MRWGRASEMGPGRPMLPMQVFSGREASGRTEVAIRAFAARGLNGSEPTYFAIDCAGRQAALLHPLSIALSEAVR